MKKRLIIIIAALSAALIVAGLIGFFAGFIMVISPSESGYTVYSHHEIRVPGFERDVIFSKQGLGLVDVVLYNGMDGPHGVQIKVLCWDQRKLISSSYGIFRNL